MTIFSLLKTQKNKAFSGAFASLSLGLVCYFNKDASSIQPKQTSNSFSYGAAVLPHPSKIAKGGEDAYFAGPNLLAVADGVGGWAELGVDPALYSRALISNVQKNFAISSKKYISNPKLLLIDSANQTKILGSSTLVLLTLDKDSSLIKSSYMGDSGYCIFRKNGKDLDLVYGSQEQQKSFNFPYQLGAEGNGDDPSLALQFEHEIKDKDLVVVGSDGLFDNMDFEQIKKEILTHASLEKDTQDVQLLADSIAKKAKEYSLSRFYNSPFAKKARESKIKYFGGKSDDITVVVAEVTSTTQNKLI